MICLLDLYLKGVFLEKHLFAETFVVKVACIQCNLHVLLEQHSKVLVLWDKSRLQKYFNHHVLYLFSLRQRPIRLLLCKI